MVQSMGEGQRDNRGFSLMEVLVALTITLVVMAAVFALLYKGQASFEREPEVAAMNQNARTGMQRLGADLTLAGHQTPPTTAVFWQDGGGNNPDQITLLYADPDSPTAWTRCATDNGNSPIVRLEAPGSPLLHAMLNRLASNPGGDPILTADSEIVEAAMQRRRRRRRRRGRRSGGGGSSGGGSTGGGSTGGGSTGGGTTGGGTGVGCGTTVGSATSATLALSTLVPGNADVSQAWAPGTLMMAMESQDCNTDGQIGVFPFTLTSTTATSADDATITYAPATGALTLPPGFNNVVLNDCAMVGFYRVVDYSINQADPDSPILQRRDRSTIGAQWVPVAEDVENLQIQYTQGLTNVYSDTPPLTPTAADPLTWITGVQLTIVARTDSRDLEGSSAGVFAANDTFVRRSFSSTVSLRNQLNSIQRNDSSVMN